MMTPLYLYTDVKGYLARKQYKPVLERRHSAIIKIQATARGYVVRKRLDREKEEMNKSAIMIQSGRSITSQVLFSIVNFQIGLSITDICAIKGQPKKCRNEGNIKEPEIFIYVTVKILKKLLPLSDLNVMITLLKLRTLLKSGPNVICIPYTYNITPC